MGLGTMAVAAMAAAEKAVAAMVAAD